MQSPFTFLSFTQLTKKKEKLQLMAPGLTNNNNNNNKNWTKQNKKNKNFATMLHKFPSLGWSELSDYNLHILDQKIPCLRVSNMNKIAENTEL